MITFDDFKASGGMPIYMQILNYVKRGIIAGTINDGDELPSRRVLSARLGINPNTVQKAFKALEDEGLILSRSGAKSYVNVTKRVIERLKEELLMEDVRNITDALKQMGITKDEALNLIAKYWEVD
ncbi:MAG: GntR family transcriptional regulator [Clostridiales bacterium]|nr:GntR family transcriptional regulator [Clostridiales bacterium]